VEVLRPVDPLCRVPLLPLALFVELQQPVAAVVVFPAKARLGVAVELPLGLLDGERIAEHRRHGGFSEARSSRLYQIGAVRQIAANPISCAPCHRVNSPSGRRFSNPSTMVRNGFPASWPALLAKRLAP